MLSVLTDTSYALYFRSFTSGNWNVAGTWESSVAAGGPWAAAASTPTSADNTVTILAGHTVRINAAVTVDEVVVNLGATLVANAAANVTFNNGAGIDLTINGTFVDSITGGGSCVFNASATWIIASGANLIRCTASASNNWQGSYSGGISTIPFDANWILRKSGTLNPSVSTTAGVGNAWYPNLICENVSGGIYSASGGANAFVPTAGGYAIIKGNFDIGGSAPFFFDFVNTCNGTKGVEVRGNMIVRPGNQYRNNGTSTEIQGSLTVDGSFTYSGTNKLDFIAGPAASINGTGTLNIYSMSINKAADITLNRPVSIDVLMTFTNGKIISSLTNIFLLKVGATVNTVTNNNSFVSGPCRKIGNEAFVFPVGKGADVQPIGTLASVASTASAFWSENFNNGCGGNCPANGYTTANGTWTVASAGTNGNRPNNFFISCTENGNAVNACGTSCVSNATLHIAPTACPTCSVCPGGDCGAVFDSVTISGNNPTTDIRVISPPINTFWRNTLVLNFKYFEGGDATDNATIEYSIDNGLSWTPFNIGKTSTACYPKGRWTASTFSFPASCNNLTNFRFAFRWANNATAGTGAPFSFAVDDLSLTGITADSYTAEYFYTNPTIVYNANYNSPLVHVSRMEYWTLTRELGSSKRKITLYWDANSGGVTSLPDLRVANFNGTGWDDKGNTATTGTTAAGTITSDSVSGVWNAFTLGSLIPYPGNPLPVELLSFRGEKKGKSVLLQWTTASEKNNDYFTLKKSSNNFNFAELTKVQGAGTTNSISNYSFTDYQPLQGLNYYKLLQTDFDGTTTDEGTIAVRFDNLKTDAIIIPDGPGQQINIQFTEVTDENLKVDLIDVTGKLILEKDLHAGEISYAIKTNNIATGIYLIRISSSNGMIYKRFSY